MKRSITAWVTLSLLSLLFLVPAGATEASQTKIRYCGLIKYRDDVGDFLYSNVYVRAGKIAAARPSMPRSCIWSISA